MVGGARAVKAAGAARPDTAPRLAALALGAAILSAFFVVDPTADAAFDAPKRLALTVGVAVAWGALTLSRGRGAGEWRWRSQPVVARAAAVLAAAAAAWAVLAAFVSPRPALAVGSLGMVVISALLVVLGASRALDGGRARALAATYVAAAAASGALAVGQASGVWQPLDIVAVPGRTSALGLVGNEGILALALALATVVVVARLLQRERSGGRRLALAALLPLLAGLAVTGGVAGILGVVAGVGAAVVLTSPRTALRVALVAGLVLAAAASMPPLRARVHRFADDWRQHDWNAVTSGRLAPWAAAVAMVVERPLVGFGPGTFAAEYVPHRVVAEERLRLRLLHPLVTSHHASAHCEPLHVAAEAGLPAALAVLAAVAALAVAARRALARGAPSRDEVAVIVALLVAGVPAALLWFPFSQPVTSIPLLLATGRLWRLCGGAP